MTQSSVSYLATDVGLWMALPAFGPAFVIVGVMIFVIRRDRRSASGDDELDGDQCPGVEGNERQ